MKFHRVSYNFGNTHHTIIGLSSILPQSTGDKIIVWSAHIGNIIISTWDIHNRRQFDICMQDQMQCIPSVLVKNNFIITAMFYALDTLWVGTASAWGHTCLSWRLRVRCPEQEIHVFSLRPQSWSVWKFGEFHSITVLWYIWCTDCRCNERTEVQNARRAITVRRAFCILSPN